MRKVGALMPSRLVPTRNRSSQEPRRAAANTPVPRPEGAARASLRRRARRCAAGASPRESTTGWRFCVAATEVEVHRRAAEREEHGAVRVRRLGLRVDDAGPHVHEPPPEARVLHDGRIAQAELLADPLDVRRPRLRARDHTRRIARQEVVHHEGDGHHRPHDEDAPAESPQDAPHRRLPAPSARSSAWPARSSQTALTSSGQTGWGSEPAHVGLPHLEGVVAEGEGPRRLVAHDRVRFAVERATGRRVHLEMCASDEVVDARVRIERRVERPFRCDRVRGEQGIEERAWVRVVEHPVSQRHRGGARALLEREIRGVAHQLQPHAQADLRQVLLHQLSDRHGSAFVEQVLDGMRPAPGVRRGVVRVAGFLHVLECGCMVVSLAGERGIVEQGLRQCLREHRHARRLDEHEVLAVDGRRDGASDLDVVERRHPRVHRLDPRWSRPPRPRRAPSIEDPP